MHRLGAFTLGFCAYAAVISQEVAIPLIKERGVFLVPCKVNGLDLKFVFDTGASDVSISATEALFMLKNGYLAPADILDKVYYEDASGRIGTGTRIILRRIEFGGLLLTDVNATVIDELGSPLLLGQSAMSKLGRFELDLDHATLKVNVGSELSVAETLLRSARSDRRNAYQYVDASKAFVKAKLYEKAISAIREKIDLGDPETNDYYYLGDAALKAKRWIIADNAWATYIERNPSAYQGYKFRARAKAGTDTLAAEEWTWAAKPYYAEALARMTIEEKEKYKADFEEGLNYLGLYFLYNEEARDLPKAKCYFERVKAMNVGSSITKQVNEVMLKTRMLIEVTPGQCD